MRSYTLQVVTGMFEAAVVQWAETAYQGLSNAKHPALSTGKLFTPHQWPRACRACHIVPQQPPLVIFPSQTQVPTAGTAVYADVTGLVYDAVSLSLQDSLDVRGENIRLCVLMLTTYVYDWTADAYVPLPSMPRGVPKQLTDAKKALRLIDKGKPKSVLADLTTPCRQ